MVGLFLLVLVAYKMFASTPYFDVLFSWSQKNQLTFFMVLLVIKISGTVIPPIPGGIFTLASIPVIGWQLAYLADLLGSMIGATIAYFLGERYGFTLLGKLFDDSTLTKLKSIKIIKGREIESVIALRILGGTIVEVVCYGAGLLKVGYINFLIGSLVSHVAMGLPIFYLAINVFSPKNLALNALLVVVYIFVFFKIKGRYFE